MFRTSYRKKRKLTPGFTIATTEELLECAKQGRWVFLGKRAYHPSWIVNMNFGCVCSYIRNAQLRFAVRDPEWPYVFVAKFVESQVPEKSHEWWVTCSELPEVGITEITKDAVIESCITAAKELSETKDPRVQVTFELPESEPRFPIALIVPPKADPASVPVAVPETTPLTTADLDDIPF